MNKLALYYVCWVAPYFATYMEDFGNIGPLPIETLTAISTNVLINHCHYLLLPRSMVNQYLPLVASLQCENGQPDCN